MKNCNICEHLSITEAEQNLIKEQGGGFYPHVCTKYKKRVFHYPYPQTIITPCKECLEEPKEGEQK